MKNVFIGIDFSKEKVDVAVVFAEGLTETAARVFNEFKNSASGFKQLTKWVKSVSDCKDASSWLFCGENTGDYSKPLCNYLYRNGYDMWLENAKSIKDASGLRRIKSDRADASMIAEYAMRNNDRAVIYEPLSAALTELRELYLMRQSFVRLKRSCQVRGGEKEFTMEKSSAKTKVSKYEGLAVSFFDEQIAQINEDIKAVLANDEELMEIFIILTSVPGIGTQNAVCLMVYTDNFRKFNFNSRKIACYYGLAPFGKYSGTSVHTDPHVHYMANRQIKAMLTQAALAAVNFNPTIGAYYRRLISAGKKKQVALNNVKNKLVHIVTAMVKNKQTFKPDYKITA
jgi:transposase